MNIRSRRETDAIAGAKSAIRSCSRSGNKEHKHRHTAGAEAETKTE